MARYNKVMIMGRLTRDPEMRQTQYGSIASFGFAVNNFKKSPDGKTVDDPCFLDLKAFDREYRKLASLVGSFAKKGSSLFVEGHLIQETWEDKNGGGKRSKVVIVCDDIQLLDTKEKATAPAPETETTPTRGGRDLSYYPDPDSSPF